MHPCPLGYATEVGIVISLLIGLQCEMLAASYGYSRQMTMLTNDREQTYYD